MAEPTTPPVPPLAVPDAQVEAIAGVSSKTLYRASKRGEPTGRRVIGRRVVYVVAELRAWLAGLPTAAPADTTT